MGSSLKEPLPQPNREIGIEVDGGHMLQEALGIAKETRDILGQGDHFDAIAVEESLHGPAIAAFQGNQEGAQV